MARWVIEVDGDYVHLSLPDTHGTVTVKAEAEGFVVDIWPAHGTESAATCAAPYSDLEPDPDTVEELDGQGG